MGFEILILSQIYLPLSLFWYDQQLTLFQTKTSSGEFDWNAEEQGIILGAFFYGYIVTNIPGILSRACNIKLARAVLY
jgi:hypothetical protein